MQNNHVSCHYVVTTTPTYCSALVDLSRSRSVHSVEHNPCCPDPTVLSASECKAVHYGLCSPLLKLPSFSLPAASALTPNSPTNSKGASPNPNLSPKDSDSSKSRSSSGPNSPRVATSVANPCPISPSTPKSNSLYHPLAAASANVPQLSGHPSPSLNDVDVPRSQMSKVDLEIFDPVELLAADLEGKLESLVNTFVAQDKVRLAARKKNDTSSPTTLGRTPLNQSKKSPSSRNAVDAADSDDQRRRQKDKGTPENPKTAAEANKQRKTPKSPLEQKTHEYQTLNNDGSSQFPDKVHSAQREAAINVLDNISPFKDSTKSSAEFLQAKTSPTILSPLKPSPEYRQTGVQAQITKFTSKEKESSYSPVNSLERKPCKSKEENAVPGFKTGPLSLDELQELLKSTSEPSPEPIQTKVFQSTRIPSVPYDGTITSSHAEQQSFSSKPTQSLQNVNPYHNNACSDSEVVYQNASALKLANSSHQQTFDELESKTPYRVNPNQEFVQSAVDYAKARFQNVQDVGKPEEVKPRTKNGHMVTEAKYKWENLPQPNWPLLSDQLVTNGDRESDHKKSMVIEGLVEGPSPSIPHPKLTNVQKQHIKERSLSPTDRHSTVPIRPFLTKGSVAERVLLFECCPDRALERTASGSKNKTLLMNTWRSGGNDVHNKMQPHHHTRDKENVDPSLRTSSLKRFVNSRSTSSKIPRFYYPDGKPATPAEIENHLQKVAAVFSGLTEGKASREEFGIITKACGLSLYWKLPLFLAARGDKRTSVSCEDFLEYWRRVVNTCHDEASKFVHVMGRGSRNYLVPEDFFPLMQDVIDSHPGLTFLKEATEFHSRYIHTVVARIYYGVNRFWNCVITIPELRKSNFLQVLSTLEEEEDINQITDYFSYEHFYVIYCKFWELDKDHDLLIDQNDLKNHNGGALSSKIIQRIFSEAVTGGPTQKEGKMSYTDFVWFLISEEDKRHPKSIEYWFRCMDLDGDGFLSMYELEYFYTEQLQRLEALGIETLPFNDCLCQMLDIIKPKIPGKISMADLKKCKMTPIFFDTFFNLEKYLDHEHRDPFASQREHDGDGPELSDWDRYAADEYELLVAEEGTSEQTDELYVLDFV